MAQAQAQAQAQALYSAMMNQRMAFPQPFPRTPPAQHPHFPRPVYHSDPGMLRDVFIQLVVTLGHKISKENPPSQLTM